MATGDLIRYLLPVTFPDGVRILEGFTTPDKAIAVQHLKQVLDTNPDVTWSPDDIQWNVTPDQAAAAREKWLAENPGRVPARDLGLDTGNRLLTNPEIARNLAAQQQQT